MNSKITNNKSNAKNKLLSSKRERAVNNFSQDPPSVPSRRVNSKKVASDTQTQNITKKKLTKEITQKRGRTRFRAEGNTQINGNNNNINHFNINLNLNSRYTDLIPNSKKSKSRKVQSSLMAELMENPKKTIEFESSIFQKSKSSNKMNITINYYSQAKNISEKKAENFINKFKNYNELLELKFLKNLAIVVEGSDFCSAAALSTDSPNTVYVTSNKLGKYSNHQEASSQESMMSLVLSDLMEKKIDVKNFNSCYNLLEILLSNIVYNSTKNERMLYEEEDKIKVLKYLYVYLKNKRPKRIMRRMLGISSIFIFPRNQTRIIRFVNAVHEILSSEIYKNLIVNGKIKIKIKRQCRINVHAELKLMDYYLSDIPDKNHLKGKDNNITGKIDVYIAPSRLPCKTCKLIINEVNKNSSFNYRFITPQTTKKQRNFNFPLPTFMTDEKKKGYFQRIIKQISQRSESTPKEKIKMKTPTSNKTDKKEICQTNSFYTIENNSNSSVEGDDTIINEVLDKLSPLCEYIQNSLGNEKVLKKLIKNFTSN